MPFDNELSMVVSLGLRLDLNTGTDEMMAFFSLFTEHFTC